MPLSKLRPAFTFDQDRIEQLQQVVPEAFRDGKVNWEALREALGDHLEPEEQPEEHFGLFWPGKREARRLASKPSKGTLVPIPGEGVDEADTRNLLIEGDNLEVLKLLQKSYAGRVKLIYIDPPYNTGQDFIYKDDFREPLDSYLKQLGKMDDEGTMLSSNSRSGGRLHSNWLNMMYPRLKLARQLLREDGCIMVSIDDNEVHNLRLLMDEIFGEANFIATVIWEKVFAPKNSARHFSVDHDYVVVYARSAETWRPNLLPRSDEANARYSNPDDDPRGVWMSDNLHARNYYSKGSYAVTSPNGTTYTPPSGRYWAISENKFNELVEDHRIWWGQDGGNMPRLKRFLSDVQQGIVPQTLWAYEDVGHTQEAKKELLDHVSFAETENVLNTVKPTRLIRRILQVATEDAAEDIVLDFFAGSGTTGHAVLAHNHDDESDGNRRYIMVQVPDTLPKPEKNLKTIADITKQRMRSVADELKDQGADGDIGFQVYRLARSNYKEWQDYDGTKLVEVQTLFDQFEMPLVDDWERNDLLTEVLLIKGFPLSSDVTRRNDFSRNEVLEFSTDLFDTRLFVCLDDELHDDTVRQLQLASDDTFVCLDNALDDQAKMRLADRCNLQVI